MKYSLVLSKTCRYVVFILLVENMSVKIFQYALKDSNI